MWRLACILLLLVANGASAETHAEQGAQLLRCRELLGWAMFIRQVADAPTLVDPDETRRDIRVTLAVAREWLGDRFNESREAARSEPMYDPANDLDGAVASLPPKLAGCKPVIEAARLAYSALPGQPNPPTLIDFDELVLVRLSYELTIRGNGMVRFYGKPSPLGRDLVRVKGIRTAQLHAGEKAALLEGLNRLRFLSLQDHYEHWLDGCERVVTDGSSVSIDLKSGPLAKSITFYNGCLGAEGASAVEEMAALIDAVAESRKWLEPRSPKR